MGRAWLSAVEDSPEVELVAVADLDQDVARQAVIGLGAPTSPWAAIRWPSPPTPVRRP
jgi:hypothetical protein